MDPSNLAIVNALANSSQHASGTKAQPIPKNRAGRDPELLRTSIPPAFSVQRTPTPPVGPTSINHSTPTPALGHSPTRTNVMDLPAVGGTKTPHASGRHGRSHHRRSRLYRRKKRVAFPHDFHGSVGAVRGSESVRSLESAAEVREEMERATQGAGGDVNAEEALQKSLPPAGEGASGVKWGPKGGHRQQVGDSQGVDYARTGHATQSQHMPTTSSQPPVETARTAQKHHSLANTSSPSSIPVFKHPTNLPSPVVTNQALPHNPSPAGSRAYPSQLYHSEVKQPPTSLTGNLTHIERACFPLMNREVHVTPAGIRELADELARSWLKAPVVEDEDDAADDTNASTVWPLGRVGRVSVNLDDYDVVTAVETVAPEELAVRPGIGGKPKHPSFSNVMQTQRQVVGANLWKSASSPQLASAVIPVQGGYPALANTAAYTLLSHQPTYISTSQPHLLPTPTASHSPTPSSALSKLAPSPTPGGATAVAAAAPSSILSQPPPPRPPPRGHPARPPPPLTHLRPASPTQMLVPLQHYPYMRNLPPSIPTTKGGMHPRQFLAPTGISGHASPRTAPRRATQTPAGVAQETPVPTVFPTIPAASAASPSPAPAAAPHQGSYLHHHRRTTAASPTKQPRPATMSTAELPLPRGDGTTAGLRRASGIPAAAPPPAAATFASRPPTMGGGTGDPGPKRGQTFFSGGGGTLVAVPPPAPHTLATAAALSSLDPTPTDEPHPSAAQQPPRRSISPTPPTATATTPTPPRFLGKLRRHRGVGRENTAQLPSTMRMAYPPPPPRGAVATHPAPEAISPAPFPPGPDDALWGGGLGDLPTFASPPPFPVPPPQVAGFLPSIVGAVRPGPGLQQRGAGNTPNPIALLPRVMGPPPAVGMGAGAGAGAGATGEARGWHGVGGVTTTSAGHGHGHGVGGVTTTSAGHGHGAGGTSGGGGGGGSGGGVGKPGYDIKLGSLGPDLSGEKYLER
ncbi:hypothetical protein HDU96_007329, partial [Phlyctochytrium bullatum]